MRDGGSVSYRVEDISTSGSAYALTEDEDGLSLAVARADYFARHGQQAAVDLAMG